MKKPSRGKRVAGKRQRGHYVLRLFMAGDGPNSRLAASNLRQLCKEHLNGRCTVETIDVVKNFGAAVNDNILVTPALILVSPLPRAVILGNLNDRAKVLLALRLSEGAS